MKQILVIEDNLEVRENIAELLELSGYAVAEAENGKEGVKLALENAPDLIICDVMMPVLDGYGTLKVLRKNPKTQQIPFVFLTAKAEKKDFRAGMNLGADDYITKPFTDVELLEAVELRLDKQERQPPVPTARGKSFFNPTQYFKEQLPDLLAQHALHSYAAGQLLFNEGDTPVALYYVQEGHLQRSATTNFGKELTLSIYGEGDFIGLPELLEKSTYHTSACTTSPCRLYVLPKTDVETWLAENNSLALHFIRLLAASNVQKDTLLLQMAYSSVRKRIAENLLRLYQQYAPANSAPPFKLSLSREALANLVGTTKETVTRTLSEFKEAKWIALKGSQMTLLDIKALEEVPD